MKKATLIPWEQIERRYTKLFTNNYIVQSPDELFYYSCCNNFFWCMQNVAKGLVRDELPYAMGMYNYIISDELNDMVSWYIGTMNDFNVSTGKQGKWFKKYLPEDIYKRYLEVYCNTDDMWQTLFKACDLFDCLARKVADFLGYDYNEQDSEGMMIYLDKMKNDKFFS